MPLSFSRLRDSIESSIKQMGKPRSERVSAVQQYVGIHHSEGGAEKAVPTNFIELAVTIYARQLAARAPRAMISTSVPSLKPHAKNMELAMNQIPDEIFLGRTLRRAVIEAIFSIGILKVGIYSSGQTKLGHEHGQFFADVVTLDDYFLDMASKTMEAIQYEGNDYWLPLSEAREMAGDTLEADDHTTTGDDGNRRAESVSVDESVQPYGDRVWTRDVWLPDKGQVLTYGVKSKKKFNTVDWDGPETGPYHKLTFSDVPGNLLPLAPVSLMRDLHDLANNLFRKLGIQADDKKTVAAFSGGNEDSVLALKKANDGDGILYSGAKPEPITVGGIDQATFALFLQVKDLVSYFGGNLDSLGGLSPQTDTVGQDRMLSAAANGRMDFMKDQTIDFARAVFKDLAWYDWTDPIRKRSIDKPVEGTDIVLHRVWSPETRDGDWLDYNFTINAYSMQNDTPTIRLQKIGQIFDRFIIPLLPMIQQQGGQINVPKLFELIGQLSNVPELNELIQFQEPLPGQPQPSGGSPQPTLQPANTTRTYERVNRPGATRQGNDGILSQLLLGGNVQPAEQKTVGRPVS